MDEAVARKNRLILLLLFAVFLAPALGSWLLYANIDHLHIGTTNHGEFVQPPREIAASGLALPTGYFMHRMTLVYVSGPGCDRGCRQALHIMQGTQLALGEQTGQVQRLYLTVGKPAADLIQGDAGLTALDGTGQAALKAFDGADAANYIYIVNPQGYVVLRYALTSDPKWILQDLRHLLGAGEG